MALADILGWLAAGSTMGETKLKRDEILDGWHLPELAKAVRNDEKASEDDGIIDGMDWLEANFGGK